MPSIVLYLLKCQICLAIVWLFYQLLLRRLTFYAMNRWYLLGYACLSFLLPLVHIVLPGEGTVTGKVQMISYIPVITGGPAAGTEAAVFTAWDILLYALALGTLLLAGRLLIRCVSLRRIRRNATRQVADLPAVPAGDGKLTARDGKVMVRGKEVMVYHVDKPIIPFSFGNAIYINPRLHTEKELHEIILHEYVHVRQRHTADILLAELLCIVSWYNPFSWLIRHAVRQNLEFIADRQVLASGLDRKSYQYHLLKVVGDPGYRLANNFNFSSLKKRIVMMNRIQSARVHLVKFVFIVPLLGVLLVAFRDKVSPHVSMDMDTGSVRASSRTMSLKSNSSDPLYILNEVEISEAESKSLNPNDIAWINILKDSEASAFGAAGENGVVLIYTKNYVKKGEVRLKNGKRIKVESRDMTVAEKNKLRLALEDTSSASVELRIRNGQITRGASSDTSKMDLLLKDRNSVDQLRKCLYIVDGMELSYENVGKMDQNRIASINVLKGQAAQAIYGSKGKDGAIIITTKGPTFTGPVTLTTIEKGDTVKLMADTIRFKLPPPVKTSNK